MNMYSTDVFLRTLCEVYFADRRCETALFAVDGRTYRLLMVDGAPITRFPFVDFLEPIGAAPGSARALGYLPSVARETLSSDDWLARPAVEGVLPSPFIEWARFACWDDFVSSVSARRGNLFPDSRRRRNKLAKALGQVEFRPHDQRPETLALGIQWKSAQYAASGYVDLFADAKNRRLFTELQARDVVRVSSLSAGGAVIAVHLGALHDGRFYWWIPSYGPEFGRFSPGRLMLESLLRASFERGDHEFDFLIGEEAYKWHYATHARVIGSAGSPPLSLRLERALKRRAKRALRSVPWLLERCVWLEQRATR